MFTNQSPLAMPYNYSNTKSAPNPQEMEMIMRQKWNNNQVVSDPYSDYLQELNSASPMVRNKIMQSEEYREIDFYCESMIKQSLYESIIPQLLNTQQGRTAFERLMQTTKKLKDFYAQEEVKANEQLQSLLQDEVVVNRLKQLQNKSADKTIQPSNDSNMNGGGNK